MPKVNFDSERCKGCELCISVCPKKIIKIADDKINSKGYRPAEVLEQDKCIGCRFCATICPDVVITIEK
ncbi:MAG: 4Fe-4S dicluster domain-containing protein [Clostridia bacterium]|nr:4Fe-4S dicluster domain-containing protein [Clostridia bacterium]